LYNGSRYPGYDPALKGHPFLDTTVLENGAVFYEGVFYDNSNLQYDRELCDIFRLFFQYIEIACVYKKVASGY
jgi:hypothetical protein